MPRSNYRPEYDDVGYGISSLSITTAGLIVVSTTACAYHGVSIIATATTPLRIFVYDSPSATSGNLLDSILVQAGDDRQGEKQIPTIAKYGLTLGVTGTGGKGSVFYGPRG